MAKITIVDDQHGAEDLYVLALRQSGFEVEHLDTVKGALLHIKRNKEPSALYIIDLMMPPGNQFDLERVAFGLRSGMEIHRLLRNKWTDVPVILLSGVSNPSSLDGIGFHKNTSWEAKIDVLPFELVEIVKSRLEMNDTRVSHPTLVLPTCGSELSAVSGLADGDDRQRWREMIHGTKQEALRKFLMEPTNLTASEFLLLSDLSQTLIHSIVQDDNQSRPEPRTRLVKTNEVILSDLMTAESSHVRGRSLEELTVRLFNSVPGFRAKSRLRTRTEEIDLFVLNGSNEAPWRDMGPALIGECKNWSSKCGTEEFSHFEGKVRNRSGQCKCAFFVSWNGFTGPFVQQRLRTSREDFLIVLIEGKHLKEGMVKSTFPEVLYRLWESAVLL